MQRRGDLVRPDRIEMRQASGIEKRIAHDGISGLYICRPK